ncbi:MAG: phospholipase D family protein [Nitrososphaerota archaeon]|nr:phospholipase D family protein [Nitrososphaerota archaeon]
MLPVSENSYGHTLKAEILQKTLWPTLTRLARKSKSTHVAVAYLGQNATRLIPLHKGDTLVIDMSENTVKAGQTDPSEVGKYFSRGVRVFTCSNLHAKLYVFGDTVIAGSPNISGHSRETLIETGVLCTDENVAKEAKALIESLAVEPVTPGYIRHCKTIYRANGSWGFPGSPHEGHRRKLPVPKHSRLWIIAVVFGEWSEKEYTLCDKGESVACKHVRDRSTYEVQSLRWPAGRGFGKRVRAGDLIVQAYDSNGRIIVEPAVRVLHLTRYKSFDKRKSPRVLIHIEVLRDSNHITWSQFRRKLTEPAARAIDKDGETEIKDHALSHQVLTILNGLNEHP